MKFASIYILLFVIFLSSSQSYAQLFSIKERKADKLYKCLNYSNAVLLYEELYQIDSSNVKYTERIASCYNKMLKYDRAYYYYSILAKENKLKPINYLDYARLLQINGYDAESKLWFIEYYKTVGSKFFLKSDSTKDTVFQKRIEAFITVKNMEGNSMVTDMCPAIYMNRLVYSSARGKPNNKHWNNYFWNGEPFLDVYITGENTEQIGASDEKLSPLLNSMYNEGSVCFSSDFKTIFFTRNNYFEGKVRTTPDGTNNLKIFIADFDGYECKNIRNFPFNSDNYSVGHPTLSPDNRTLFFVSDMPGGFGGTDIYRSEVVNSTFSEPVNLGAGINTWGMEMFPTTDKYGNLYFSTNGREGVGGLDIFGARMDKKGNYKVVPIVSPINSTYDDFEFALQPDSLEGYFSSNRPGGKGEDDIYSFKVNKVELLVTVYDEETKQILPKSKVTLLAENGKVIQTQIANEKGKASFLVSPDLKCQLMVEANLYLSATTKIQIKASLIDLLQKKDIYLKRGFSYLTVRSVDRRSGEIIQNSKIDITKGKYNPMDVYQKDGVLRMKLQSSAKYSFYSYAKGFIPNTVKYASKNLLPGEYELTIELDTIKVGRHFEIEDLFYDFGKYNIRPDAALILDKLVLILKENPQIRVEIGSHTDSRASFSYNQRLSENRSKSVVAYLVSKGIRRDRLVPRGYGESQLVNKCKDGVKCTEEQHQANRRTVITILNAN